MPIDSSGPGGVDRSGGIRILNPLNSGIQNGYAYVDKDSIGNIIGFSSIEGNVVPVIPNNILTKSLCGGVAVTDATTSNYTSNHQMVLAAPFHAVRIGVRNAHTADITGIKVQVAPSSTFGVAGTAASRTPTSSFTNCTFGGAATGTLVAGAAANDTITWFDWTEISSVARSDSGTLPVLHVRVESPTDATNNRYTNFNIGDWTGLNTEANIAGNRGYIAVNQATDGITTPANFTQTTSTSTPIAIVVQYATLIPGKTIMTLGDSLSQGGGSTYKCYSDTERASFSASTVSSPVEVCNFGWGGQNTATYYLRALSKLTSLAEIKPTHLIYAPFSPNDGATITATTINAMKSRLARVIIATKAYGVNLILANGLPSTPGGTSGVTFGATDPLRISFNNDMLKYGYIVYDRASILNDGLTATGQVTIIKELTTDNLHPNETGWNVLATKLSTILGL